MHFPERLAHLLEPEQPSRPWWAVPLVLVGLVAAAAGALTYRYGQAHDRQGALLLGLVLLALGASGLLFGWLTTIRSRVAAFGQGPRWPARAAALGAAAFLIGWWLHHSVTEQRLGCDLVDVLGALANLIGDKGPRAVSGCGTVRAQYAVSIGLLILGPALLVCGLLFGMPFRVRRLSRRLHISPEGLTGLTLAVLLLAAAGGRAAWSSHEHDVEISNRGHAQQALAALQLPADLTGRPADATCQPTIDTRCARSSREPQELEVALSRLLHGHRDDAPCRLIPLPAGQPCPLYVRGTLAGYPAVGWAFPRTAGGSDVMIELVTPEDS